MRGRFDGFLTDLKGAFLAGIAVGVVVQRGAQRTRDKMVHWNGGDPGWIHSGRSMWRGLLLEQTDRRRSSRGNGRAGIGLFDFGGFDFQTWRRREILFAPHQIGRWSGFHDGEDRFLRVLRYQWGHHGGSFVVASIPVEFVRFPAALGALQWRIRFGTVAGAESRRESNFGS